ncbi:MAG TPA: hypothetical protein PK142_03200 [bacterium]|nr:hypothetical protein [bacterium]
MKTKLFLLIAIGGLLALGSCQKLEFNPDGSDGSDPDPVAYTWPGCNPKPVEFLSKTEAPGWPNCYDYSFRLSLDGSQTDPNPLTLESFSIPHVGPGGITIYENVENDATYTITKVSGGYIYYTIRSERGHTLKYNISKRDGTREVWFLRYGLTVDDGVNNMVTFTAD